MTHKSCGVQPGSLEAAVVAQQCVPGLPELRGSIVRSSLVRRWTVPIWGGPSASSEMGRGKPGVRVCRQAGLRTVILLKEEGADCQGLHADMSVTGFDCHAGHFEPTRNHIWKQRRGVDL